MAQIPNKSFDVVAIGNAIVDVLAHADDAFLDRPRHGKGSMTLIDDERARTALRRHGPRRSRRRAARRPTRSPASPRSAGAPRFIGKVADDQLGEVFAHDIRAAGVALRPPRRRPAAAAPPAA